MQIIIYDPKVKSVSGVKTAELQLCYWLNKIHKVKFVYKYGDVTQFKEVCEVEQDNGQQFECDILIQSSIFVGEAKVKYKKKIQIVHTDLKFFNVTPPPADLYIAVSDMVKNKLKEDFNIDAVMIPNLLGKVGGERVIRLITLTRLEKNKGIERMVKMAKKMEEMGILFEWSVYGEGLLEMWLRENMPLSMSYKGNKPNATSFIEGNNYLVQLSDSEGFCYSAYEALLLGIPVLITKWEGSEKLVAEQGINGYRLEMDLSNLTSEMMLDLPVVNPFGVIPDNETVLQEWNKVLL
jgi:glycosyltransferase involved in cell wall biosynthesis